MKNRSSYSLGLTNILKTEAKLCALLISSYLSVLYLILTFRSLVLIFALWNSFFFLVHWSILNNALKYFYIVLIFKKGTILFDLSWEHMCGVTQIFFNLHISVNDYKNSASIDFGGYQWILFSKQKNSQIQNLKIIRFDYLYIHLIF